MIKSQFKKMENVIKVLSHISLVVLTPAFSKKSPMYCWWVYILLMLSWSMPESISAVLLMVFSQ